MACIIIVLHMVIVISHKHKPFSKITVINILVQSQIMFAPHFPFPYFTHICKQHWNWQFSQTFYYLTFCLHTSPYSPNSPSFPIFLQHTHTHTHTHTERWLSLLPLSLASHPPALRLSPFPTFLLEGSSLSGPFNFPLWSLVEGIWILGPRLEGTHVPDPSLPDIHGGGSAKGQCEDGQIGEGRLKVGKSLTL